MTFEFAIKHWILTLLIAPVFNFLILIGLGKPPVLEYIPLYLFWLIFSIGFSLPAFLIYLFVQWIARKYISSDLRMRILLSAVAISCLLLTVYFFVQELSDFDFLASYSFAIVLTAYFIKEGSSRGAVETLK